MKKILTFSLTLVVLVSCTLKEQIKTFHDSEINAEVQLEMDANINQLIQNIIANDCQSFTKNASEAFKMVLNEQSCMDFEWIHNQIHNAKFTTLSSVYAKKSLDMSVARFSGQLAKDDYDFAFNQAKKESHLTFIEAELESKSFLITLVYSKIDNKWLLDVFNIGEYKLHAKTALDYFALSKELAASGSLIEAYIQFELCQKLMKPSGDHFRYQKQSELEQYKEELENNIKTLQFPIEISEITTKPSLYSISLLQTDEGWLPVFLYKSTLNLNDTIQLKSENNQVHNFIKTAYPTIFKTGFSKSLYRVANEIKEDNTNYPSYGFTVELD